MIESSPEAHVTSEIEFTVYHSRAACGIVVWICIEIASDDVGRGAI